MKRTGFWISILIGLLVAGAVPACLAGDVADYNVVWDSPSRDHAGSMPLGNGDIGINAWVEPNGDVLFYLGKSDSWGDNGRLLKVGKIRLRFDPPLFAPGDTFRQELDLATGTLRVACDGKRGKRMLALWVDANSPAVHVTLDSPVESTGTASIELWRIQPETLSDLETSDVNVIVHRTTKKKKKKHRAPTVVEPDTILKGLPDRIGWHHHNRKSVGPATMSRLQGLDGFSREDPLLHRTFGAVVLAERGRRVDDTHLESPAAKSHRFSVYVLTQHPATPESWLKELNGLITTTEKRDFNERRREHETWWRAFWDRSWIHATPAANKTKSHLDQTDETYIVSRAYALQRFITAAAGRGRYPVKFNGSLFTVPAKDKPGDADYRRWGPGFWWQNTRLPYLSMCASGDFDMMGPLVRFYVDELLPLCKYRTRHYLGHDGAYYPECMYFWGDVFSISYGPTLFERRKEKLQESGYHKWEWVCGLELAWMLLDYYEHTRDEAFLHTKVLPLAHEVLTFFDQDYKTGPDDKLVMHPAQAVEKWWDCTNPMPELAGLHALTARLLTLPENRTTEKDRAFWRALAAKLPELPTREAKGVRMLAPAKRFAKQMNGVESPELYAVYPFRLVSFDKPNKDLGVQAFVHRDGQNYSGGWLQEELFAAYLGLSEDARRLLVKRAGTSDPDSRFPAFWGPNFDWVPDQDHGGILVRAFQTMLMQTDGRRIFLLPAWPKQWDVDFRLHAPYRTTLEGTVRGGKLVKLNVTPPSRSSDVTVIGIAREEKTD
ncbi:MAG: hypothetical protein JW818_23755 [Pirellulales bacterium]|nr:hypothetical protein [Pirellulales bacterium]